MSNSRQIAVFDPRRKPEALVSTLSYTYRNGHVVPPHFHEQDQVLYGISGVMAVTTSEGLWIVPPNRAVWIPARTTHSIAMWGSLIMKTIYLRPGWVKLKPACFLINVSPLLRELLLEACKTEILYRHTPAHVRLVGVLRDQLQASPFLSLQVRMPVDARALRLANRLLAGPDRMQRLDLVIQGSGASRRTLERLFWEETGVSFGRWRRQIQLAHAVRLLAEGQKITAVAMEVGYNSPSAFIATFKKVFGSTPSKYLAS